MYLDALFIMHHAVPQVLYILIIPLQIIMIYD